MIDLLFEKVNEFQCWFEEPLLRCEKVFVTAEMRSVLVVADHHVLILNDLLDWNAIPIDDRVILDEVNESGNAYVLDVRSA